MWGVRCGVWGVGSRVRGEGRGVWGVQEQLKALSALDLNGPRVRAAWVQDVLGGG